MYGHMRCCSTGPLNNAELGPIGPLDGERPFAHFQ
jgi:hypothetical protein